MKNKGKWKIIERNQVYKNPWITVSEDSVIRPDGKEGIHAFIYYKPGVAVLPIDDEGNVYLVKEFRYAISDEGIEVVAGGIEEGDTPFEAAKKELREELGIVAADWVELGIYHPLTETVFTPSHFYLARDLAFREQKTEGTEDIRIVKMPLRKAVKKVLDGEINFALAGLIILIAWEKFGKK